MKNRSRRRFLSVAGKAFAAAGAGVLSERLGLVNALAQSSAGCEGYKALVCVFLFGGNDATNMVLPVEGAQAYADYSRVRGPLALPEVQVQRIQSKTGGAVYALHPRLADLRALYERNRLAVVLNVGTLVRPITKQEYLSPGAPLPGNLFSHSDQQSQWQNSTPSIMTPTGWGGRLADRMQRCNTPATFPLVLSTAGNNLFGDGVETRMGTLTPNAAVGLQGFDGLPNPRHTAYTRLLELDNGVELVKHANRIAVAGINDAGEVNAALANPTRLTTVFPNTSLGQQLLTVARIIEAHDAFGLRRQVFFCSLGGFDTHQNQLGTHDALMTQLGAALAAFHEATAELGQTESVTTFTASEFGRTAQPNSNNGSDHGWGSHHLVMGGAVKGGETYGSYPDLALGGPQDANVRGVYIPTTGLDQYNATLATWFGLASSDMAAVFPNLSDFPSANLGFLA
jgi:uncharacterized protein (DUF1501 family)